MCLLVLFNSPFFSPKTLFPLHCIQLTLTALTCVLLLLQPVLIYLWCVSRLVSVIKEVHSPPASEVVLVCSATEQKLQLDPLYSSSRT